MRNKQRILTIVSIAIAAVSIAIAAMLSSAPANAQTNSYYSDSLCANIVDSVRINNAALYEFRGEAKEDLLDLAMSRLESDVIIVKYYESIEYINLINVEIELLNEIYIDHCEDKSYD